MGWNTSSESYGSFLNRDTNAWSKAYVNRLPQTIRNKKIADLHVNGPSTTCDYGTFYRPNGISNRTTIYKPKTGLGEVTYKVTERTLNQFNTKPLLRTPFKSVPNKANPKTIIPGVIPVRPELVKLAALKPMVKAPQQNENRALKPAIKATNEPISSAPCGTTALTTAEVNHRLLGRTIMDHNAKKSVLPAATQTLLQKSAPSLMPMDNVQVHNSPIHGRHGQMTLPEIKRVDVQLVTKNNEIIPLAPVDKTVQFANGMNSLKDIRDFDLNIGMSDGTRYKVTKTTPRT